MFFGASTQGRFCATVGRLDPKPPWDYDCFFGGLGQPALRSILKVYWEQVTRSEKIFSQQL